MTSQDSRCNAFDQIETRMRLRAPQLEALKKLHTTISDISLPLHEATYSQVSDVFKAKFPQWRFVTDQKACPEFTVHLATGVGKTKFIGAAIAYLFNAGEARNFLIITPRAEVIRKFIREIHPEHSKYIFGDKSILSEVQLVTAENIQSVTFNQQLPWDQNVPYIWILSPQSFTARGAKIKLAGDHGSPAVSFLKQLDDLVVFFDESHHLGDSVASISAWKKEIYDLEPRLIIGTTASISAQGQTNLLYSYPLKRSLKEKLFTKQVQIIADKIDPSISEDEQDHIALRYAIQRRDEKESALQDYVVANGLTKTPKPILLVCCTDIAHAEVTSSWICDYLGNDSYVRVIHSELNESTYLPWLLSLEQENSQVRVVVQVSMLNEGWDVSTVYGICPLRQMNSITMVEQVMGRGLRLPFGKPTGEKMIDELDIICFGRKSVQDLANDALSSGYSDEEITIHKLGEETRHTPSIKVELFHCRKENHPEILSVPLLRRRVRAIDLTSVSVPSIEASEIHGFEISDPQTIRELGGSLSILRPEFLSVSSSIAIRKASYLSETRQKNDMISLIDGLLKRSGFTDNFVSLSPEAVAVHVKNYLDVIYTTIPPEYFPTGKTLEIPLINIEVFRPENYKIISELALTTDSLWANANGKQQLISGWKRCIHREVPFDAFHEMTIARCIDRCPEVTWWLRNLPTILALDTPAGRYSPDFAIFLTTGNKNILLEVKGDIYAESELSTARIKKQAAELWCNAVSQNAATPWEYWFLLDSDAKDCNTWSDIVRKADKG